MPRINIHEHSETYSFQTRNNSYGTVALPIAAIWGPAYVEGDEDTNPDWVHFSSGYRGTTDFMSTFRGPNTYLGAREKSFDYALKLLAAGYDILVKRVDGLGNKSHNDLFPEAAGTPAYMTAGLKPESDVATEYAVLPYRLYMPLPTLDSQTGKIVWSYSDPAFDDDSIRCSIVRKVRGEGGKWVDDGTENNFRIQAKSTGGSLNLQVIVGKPNIITSQIKTSNVSISVSTAIEKGKMVTTTGTVPISVFTSDGTLLERRNITITETTEYMGASAPIQANIKVDSVLVPEFTYIQIDEIPALLSLKAVYDEDIKTLYANTSAAFGKGLFVFNLGTAWTPTEGKAEASLTATGVTRATVDYQKFSNKVQGVDGTYTFTCNNGWTLGTEETQVNLEDYGITITGTAATDDVISVAFTLGADPNILAADHTEGVANSIPESTNALRLVAKFPGTFGNNLKVRVRCGVDGNGYKIGTVEVFNNNGYRTHPNEIVPTDQLLELVSVAFDDEAATDNRPLITEATLTNLDTPKFINYTTDVEISPAQYPTGAQVISLLYGTDYVTELTDAAGQQSAITAQDVTDIVAERFNTSSSYYSYIEEVAGAYASSDQDALIRLYNQQVLYKRFYSSVDELTDPIVYDWDALIQGIADDQYVPKSYLESHPEFYMDYEVSALVIKMIQVAAESKCGATFLGTPFGMPRGIQTGIGANAVKTGALKYKDSVSQAVGAEYSTFGEVVGPWCKTTLPIAGSNSWIAPEVAHLLLIINAKGIGGVNKWWMVPAGMLGSGIVHSPEYKIKKHYLDLIQDHDQGVCLNPLMEVPGKGFTCFGNSTLWDKPLGTYNALQNLSTRLLTNRVKQRIWDTALQILFRYNNEDAYSHFYAGLSPLLDEMRSVGALTGNEYNPWGYRIIMNPDIINLDRINANTVIGKVELAVTGVIDTVDVDLFLLPPTGFQETYD